MVTCSFISSVYCRYYAFIVIALFIPAVIPAVITRVAVTSYMIVDFGITLTSDSLVLVAGVIRVPSHSPMPFVAV